MNSLIDELGLVAKDLSGNDLLSLMHSSKKNQKKILDAVAKPSFLLDRMSSYKFYSKEITSEFLADRDDPDTALIAARMVLLGELIDMEPSSTVGFFVDDYRKHGMKVIETALSLIPNTNLYPVGCSKSILFAISLDTDFAINLVLYFCSNPMNINNDRKQYDDYYDDMERRNSKRQEKMIKAMETKEYKEFMETKDYKLLNEVGFTPYDFLQDGYWNPFEEYLGDVHPDKADEFISELFNRNRFFGHYYLTRFFLSPIPCKNKVTLLKLYHFAVVHKVSDALFYMDKSKRDILKYHTYGFTVSGPRDYSPYMIKGEIKFCKRSEVTKFFGKFNLLFGLEDSFQSIKIYNELEDKDSYVKDNNYANVRKLLFFDNEDEASYYNRWDQQSAMLDYILATISDRESCLESLSDFLTEYVFDGRDLCPNCIARLLVEDDFVLTLKAKTSILDNFASKYNTDWLQ